MTDGAESSTTVTIAALPEERAALPAMLDRAAESNSGTRIRRKYLAGAISSHEAGTYRIAPAHDEHQFGGWSPFFESTAITAVFSGNDHRHERARPRLGIGSRSLSYPWSSPGARSRARVRCHPRVPATVRRARASTRPGRQPAPRDALRPSVRDRRTRRRCRVRAHPSATITRSRCR